MPLAAAGVATKVLLHKMQTQEETKEGFGSTGI
jgi:hypothetical protein